MSNSKLKKRKRERMMSGLEWAERERARRLQFGYRLSADDPRVRLLEKKPLWIEKLSPKTYSNVILYVRASTQWQVTNGNRDDDEKKALAYLKRKGYNVIRVIRCVERSRILDPTLRPALDRAFALADIHDAVVVASSRDRFVRGKKYNRSLETESPSPDQWLELRMLAGVADYATISHPKKHGRSEQTKRGQQKSKNKPGRRVGSVTKTPGYKKRRREKLMPKVLEMRRRGFSFPQIEMETGVPWATAHRWEKHPEN